MKNTSQNATDSFKLTIVEYFANVGITETCTFSDQHV